MKEPKLDITFKLSEIEQVANKILNNLTHKVILFYGEMGSGKTTLIKALISALGCEDEVNSPTFSIVNEYAFTDGKIFHFDLYRIEDEEEALNFGIEDYFVDDSWVFVEWPQIIESLIPQAFHRIEITQDSNLERKLILK